MKKLLPLLLVVGMIFALAAFASDKASAKSKNAMTGWLVDDKCGAKAAHEGNEACTKKCLDAGAKLAFVNDANKEVTIIQNPDAVKGHEGHHVKLNGSLQDGQLHVDNVAMVSGGESAEHKH